MYRDADGTLRCDPPYSYSLPVEEGGRLRMVWAGWTSQQWALLLTLPGVPEPAAGGSDVIEVGSWN